MINELLRHTLTDFEIMVLAGAAFALMLSAFIGWRIGKRKSRPMLGVMLGMFLAIPGLFAIALIPTKEPAYY